MENFEICLKKLSHKLLLEFMLDYFNIPQSEAKDYVVFCELESRSPLQDFVENFLLHSPNKKVVMLHKGLGYKFYIVTRDSQKQNKYVYFSKYEDKRGVVVGTF